MRRATTIDPRLRVLYLVAIAVGVFLFKRLDLLAALLASQMTLWLVVRLGPRRLARQITKLWGFALFVVASYALTAEDPKTDIWIHLPIWKWSLSVNTTGALLGLAMVVRVLIVVMASQIARAGDSRSIADGLGKLGAPPVVAGSIDAVLALMGGGGRGRGGGGGGGGGGRRASAGARGGDRGERSSPVGSAPEARRSESCAGGATPPLNVTLSADEGFIAGVKRLARGDVGAILERIERQIARAEEHASAHGNTVRDVAVIAGVSLTMLGIKALKVLPSIPFAPGHKLVILTPLYVVASLRTRSRMGATLTGLTMGTVAFLLGDGRYGIFEILKHVAPGVVCDLLAPVLLRGKPGRFGCSLLGGLMGAGRFATIFTVTLAVQPPAIAWAMLLPGFLIHTGFGFVSGYVTYQLVRARGAPGEPPREPSRQLERDHETVTSGATIDEASFKKANQ